MENEKQKQKTKIKKENQKTETKKESKKMKKEKGKFFKKVQPGNITHTSIAPKISYHLFWSTSYN